jgi:16S rRNA (guanine966-N2)-methyltransferase
MFSALVSLGGVEGAAVVDLFAGSGALGIEALSRGAQAAIFVETDRAALETIRSNLRTLGLGGPDVRVLAGDAERAAGSAQVTSADVVFADPPYRFEGWPDLLGRLAGGGFSGMLVAESARAVTAPGGWDVVREKAYGSTVVTMLCPAPARRPEGLTLGDPTQ